MTETSNVKAMLLSNYTVSDSKKSRFIEEQEKNRLLRWLEIQKSLLCTFSENIKTMNATNSKVLLAGDKFMPEMHLKQPEFTYSTLCWPFTKTKKEQKYSKKRETPQTSIKTNWTKIVFDTTWFMVRKKI